MPAPVDTRHAGAVIATKDNIVPDDTAQGQRGAAGVDGSTVLYVEGTDAATGASGVVTVDTSQAPGSTAAADTGALPVGEYAYYAEVTHPSAAAANREVQIQHRDSGNAANIGLYATFAAGSGKRIKRGKFFVETANERLRLVTGTDITNANIAVKLFVWKID